MSGVCPHGQTVDAERTPFGLCLDSVRTLDPTRPDPSRDRPDEGSGRVGSLPLNFHSPDPVTSTQREVWHHLTEGLGWLSLNDHGRNWPLPRRDRLRALTAEFPDDLCVKAAREAREIVKAQDRAPNITALFEKKLRNLAAVRNTVRESLGAAA